MPDFRITCKAGSLLEYYKPVAGIPLIKFPYFHVDFPIETIKALLEPLVVVGLEPMKAAGICLVPTTTQSTLYAFKVVWNPNQIGDLVADSNNENIVDIEVPGALLPAVGDVPAFIEGTEIWRQSLTNEDKPDQDQEMAFAFFSYDALQRLLSLADGRNFQYIRFRRLLVNSKKKVKKTNPLDLLLNNGVREKYQNLIAELAPTWAEKYKSSQTATGLTMTDEDATANEYGHPCPPIWNQNFTDGSPVQGYVIMSSKQTIKIANGAAIRISDLFGALMNNAEAKKLLEGWKSYRETKVLVVKNGGKAFEVVNP